MMKKDFQKGDLVLVPDKELTTGVVKWRKGIIYRTEVLSPELTICEVINARGRVFVSSLGVLKPDLKTIRTIKIEQILK